MSSRRAIVAELKRRRSVYYNHRYIPLSTLIGYSVMASSHAIVVRHITTPAYSGRKRLPRQRFTLEGEASSKSSTVLLMYIDEAN